MAKITYDNKIQLNENANIPNNQKCRAVDMNEIKSVVNENDTNVGSLSNLNTTDKTSVIDAINEVNTNQINSSTYSTDEIVVGTWLGKPLYRKVIVQNGVSDGNVSIPHNISNIKMCTKASLYANSGNLTYKDGNELFKLILNTIDTQNINITTTNAFNNWKLYFILEYIKTTD